MKRSPWYGVRANVGTMFTRNASTAGRNRRGRLDSRYIALSLYIEFCGNFSCMDLLSIVVCALKVVCVFCKAPWVEQEEEEEEEEGASKN